MNIRRILHQRHKNLLARIMSVGFGLELLQARREDHAFVTLDQKLDRLHFAMPGKRL
ncbi:MAG: hypothetical protein FWD53_08610 [Phycisphaerales bacterium]|nr:hypothetical protein [Phycisphaerales bacterium]